MFDLFLLVACWELISFISFFLVQHWAYRLPTYKAGMKVFFISQVGDLPFFAFIFLFSHRYLTTDLSEILAQVPLASFEYLCLPLTAAAHFLTLGGLLLSSAILLKAAQFLFYPWLLDAMEAPVPISAQLHSSTLVVIGFYLYYRFLDLFVFAPSLSSLYLSWGICTVVGASLLGFFQEDGKRLLACSTASQLGYVVTACGLGLYEEGALLLVFCCCNKALTFVWFGVLMDRTAGVSDFRFLGGQGVFAWAEHCGLAVSIANFTVLPGAFSWHAKSLFLKGELLTAPYSAAYALDVLLLT